MAKRLLNNWSRITRLKINPQEIVDLFEELTAIRAAEGHIDDWFTAMVVILIRRYPKNISRVFCISERAHCLKAMMDDPRWRGWMRQDRDPDCIWIDSSIYAAVAKCPLRQEKERFHFISDEFFAIALRERDGEVERPQ